jgi:tRNA dimethylallyltransferase
MSAHERPALLLMGPTGSGKSALALALAHELGGEIISVDSAQVYRRLDIGTAKPDAATRAAVSHHLVDIVDPHERYGAARFVADAVAAIAAVRGRGALPVVVGGTMLYFKALREGLSALPAADPVLRATIDARAAREGWPALHAQLAAVDPRAASRIAIHDAQRIQRALEVYALAGVPLSVLQGRRAGAQGIDRARAVALVPGDRARLHRDLAERFDAMLEAGLVDEVAGLRADPRITPDLPSMRAVGYRQVWEHLAGTHDRATMRERAIAATRQLAKRQYTWLRTTDAEPIDPYTTSVDAVVAKIAAGLRVI